MSVGDLATNFCNAAKAGSIEMMEEYLINGVDVNTYNELGETALMKASFYRHGEAVNFLISRGADVNKFGSRYGSTPLMWACEGSGHEIIDILHTHGANLDHQNFEQNTGLHRACFYGHTKCAEKLVAYGANVNSVNLNKQTPLHVACLKAHTAIIRCLIQNGADTEAPDVSGCSPLDLIGNQSVKAKVDEMIQEFSCLLK